MMARRRIRIALAGVGLALFVVLAALAGILLPEARPAAAHTFTLTANSISINSSAGTDTNYVTGDTITLRVVFNDCINSHINGAIGIVIGANTRSATPASATPNSATVDFSYTVIAADEDTDGITVPTNAVSGAWGITPGAACSTLGAIHHHPSPSLPNTLASAQAAHRVNVVIDYDTDGDNLIDITTLAQLDAVRHDLNGDGDPTAGTGTTRLQRRLSVPRYRRHRTDGLRHHLHRLRAAGRPGL